MATFKVEVKRIKVSPHPDPEVNKLEVGQIDDYNVVIGKGSFKTNDLVAYIPEQAIVPNDILEELNLVGRLAGSNKNRVKAIKLRGVMSQGLVYKARPDWSFGDDVTEELGIIKYEPPIPPKMAGEFNSHSDISLKFDIENFKAYPDIIPDGEEVIFTEKVHGTFIMVGLPHYEFRREDMIDGKLFVSSKGMGAKGLYLKDNDKNKENVYIRAVRNYGLAEKLENMRYHFINRPCREGVELNSNQATLWLLGEVYGVQKGYGYGANGGYPGFRAFAVKVGNKYLPNRDLFEAVLNAQSIPFTPVLYRGPFSKKVLKEYTDGMETVSGEEKHIREGVVITLAEEQFNGDIGRIILKSVSDAYLGKSTGEEIN